MTLIRQQLESGMVTTMIDDPIFYVLAVVAVLINAIGKSGFGGGIGVLSVPLLSLVIPTAQAAAIMLPLLCVMDLLGFWHYKDKWDFRNVAVLLPAALIGILMGVCFFRYLQEGQIRITIGLIAVLQTTSFAERSGFDGLPVLVGGRFWA